MAKEIKLSQGKVALVDDDDFDRINSVKWSAIRGRSTWYAIRHVWNGFRRVSESMHRVILNAPKDFEVDHTNGDGCDNRKSNLRIATTSQNQHNQKKHKNSTSQFKGVGWHKPLNKWRASIRVNGHRFNLGYFNNENDAARAYNEAAKKYFGEFARLNVIDRND